jgi:hypothetical protein
MYNPEPATLHCSMEIWLGKNEFGADMGWIKQVVDVPYNLPSHSPHKHHRHHRHHNHSPHKHHKHHRHATPTPPGRTKAYKTLTISWGKKDEDSCKWQCTCAKTQTGCNSQDKCFRYQWTESTKKCVLYETAASAYKTFKITWTEKREEHCKWQCNCAKTQVGCNSEGKCDHYLYSHTTQKCALYT